MDINMEWRVQEVSNGYHKTGWCCTSKSAGELDLGSEVIDGFYTNERSAFAKHQRMNITFENERED